MAGTQCGDKKRYGDADAARDGLRNIRTMHSAWNLDKQPCRFYRCPECRGYHLTSVPKSARVEASCTPAR